MDFDFGHGYEVAIIGATGCLGRELVQQVGNVLPIRKLHLFASVASQGEYVDVDGESIRIQALKDVALPTDVRAAVHMVFLCCPPETVLTLGYELSEEGIAVVDLTGALGESVGFSLGGLADKIDNFQSHRMICLPTPSTAALARIWEALHVFQPIQLSSVVSVSASRFGQRGIEELAKQVRGLLNFQEAPQVLFPDGLAFDILPSIGDGTHVVESERQMSIALADILALEPNRFRHRIQVAPIFSGVSMHVQLSLGSNVVLEEVLETLDQSAGVQLQQVLSTLRSTSGDVDVLVGRVDINPWVQGVELQVQLDNVSFAVHNALMIVQRFHSMDVL